jgi:HAD superfamily hydrolase (TIGR01490 family)
MSQRPFAVFDIDGTLIRWQLYHAITDAFARLGYIDANSHKAIKDARMNWKRRVPGKTFRDYELEVIRIYESALSGLDASQLDEVIDLVFAEYKDQVYIYTRDLIRELKAKNYLLFAISGSQSEIVARIAAHYQIDDYVGTSYEHEGGRFTGNKVIGSHHKDKSLKAMVERHKASWRDSLAVGDSHSDIAMLELVEKPIAFNPESKLYEHARQQGWDIVIERKNIVFKVEQKNGTYLLA